MSKDTPVCVGKVVRAICVIFSAIGTGLIVGNGSILQSYLAKLVTSNESSIYSSMHGENLVSLPALSDWLWFVFTNPAVLCGIPIMAGLFVFKKARDIYIGTLAISAISITVIDLVYNLAYQSDNLPSMAENLLFNSLGGLLIAAIALGLLSLTLFISSAEEHKGFNVALSAILPIMIAAFVGISTYYISAFFYLPVDTRLDVTVKTPISLMYTAKEDEGSKFSVFDENSEVQGDMRIVSPYGETLTVIKNLGSSNVKGSVELLSGCMQDTFLKASGSSDRKFFIDDVKNLEVLIDKGPSDLFLGKVDGKVNFDNEELLNVSMEPSTNNEFGISRFIVKPEKIMESSSVTYTPKMALYKIYIAMPLFKSDEKTKTHLSKRQIKITINGKSHTVIFQPQKMLINKKFECTRLDISALEKYSRQRASEVDGVGGIVVSIFKEKDQYDIFDKDETSISVKNINGWVALDKVKKDDLKKIVTGGMLEGIVIQQGISSLKVDGVSRVTSGTTTLSVRQASLYGYQVEPGVMRFYGTAEAAFIDQERLNETRWEKIDIALKIALLSAFGLLLLKLTSVVFLCVSRNESL